jgi:SAM-dependent methyltransferase
MTTFRALSAGLLFRIGGAAQRVARVTDYLAIGTRQLADLRRDSVEMWQSFYDTHGSHDSRLLPWECEVVDRFIAPGADVLLIGCGSGRDLLPLAARSCRVTGLDPVRSSLDIARRMLATRGLDASLVEGFFEETPLEGAFDAVIFSYYCYSVIPELRRRTGMLQKAASLLKGTGHIVVSVGSTDARPHAWLVRIGQLSGALCRSDWRVEPGDLVWNNRQSAPSYSYTHAFEPGELEREAQAANLAVVYRHTSQDNTTVVVLSRR